MFCSNCGSQQSEGARFCFRCGAALGEVPLPGPSEVADAPAPTPEPAPSAPPVEPGTTFLGPSTPPKPPAPEPQPAAAPQLPTAQPPTGRAASSPAAALLSEPNLAIGIGAAGAAALGGLLFFASTWMPYQSIGNEFINITLKQSDSGPNIFFNVAVAFLLGGFALGAGLTTVLKATIWARACGGALFASSATLLAALFQDFLPRNTSTPTPDIGIIIKTFGVALLFFAGLALMLVGRDRIRPSFTPISLITAAAAGVTAFVVGLSNLLGTFGNESNSCCAVFSDKHGWWTFSSFVAVGVLVLVVLASSLIAPRLVSGAAIAGVGAVSLLAFIAQRAEISKISAFVSPTFVFFLSWLAAFGLLVIGIVVMFVPFEKLFGAKSPSEWAPPAG